MYLSLIEEPAAGEVSPGQTMLPKDWNEDGWFDRIPGLSLRTEKEVEIKFSVPLLAKLGYSDEDRFDGMPVPASHGSRGSTLVIDHAAFNAAHDVLKGQPLITVEAKRDSYLSKEKQLRQAHDQAKSYCYWTQCDFCMVTDSKIISVYRVGHGRFDSIESIFECARHELKGRFEDLYGLVSKESLTMHYLKRLSAVEEAL